MSDSKTAPSIACVCGSAMWCEENGEVYVDLTCAECGQGRLLALVLADGAIDMRGGDCIAQNLCITGTGGVLL